MEMSSHTIVNNENVRPMKKKNKRGKIGLFVVSALAVLAFLGYRFFVPQEETYQLASYQTAVVTSSDFVSTGDGSGTVSFPRKITLASPQEGYAATLLVAEGDEVAAGEPLLTLDVPDLEDELEDYDFSLLETRNERVTTAENQAITIARAEREIERLRDDLAEAQEDVDRTIELVAIGASRQSELDDAEAAYRTIEEELEEAVAQLQEDRSLNALTLATIDQTIERYETLRERTLDDIEEATITSPFAGTVPYISDSASVSGSQIEKGDELITVADPSSAVVELDVAESDADSIRVGDVVDLTISGTALSGTVTAVGTTAELADGSLEATVVVTVRPDAEGLTLLQGATATGEFDLGSQPDTLVLPRGSYLSTGSQRWMYRITESGDRAEKTEVVFGEILSTQVEVLNGLAAGDEVIISGYQNFVDYNVVELAQ
jgi:HlyD family secretion protein